MRHAGFVRRIQRGDDLNGKLQNVDQLQTSPGKMFTQRYAVDVFRRYKRTRLRLPKFINSENVWMIEIRDSARFLRKALQAILVFRNFSRHDLERHSPAQFRSILRQVNLAHPARPQL